MSERVEFRLPTAGHFRYKAEAMNGRPIFATLRICLMLSNSLGMMAED